MTDEVSLFYDYDGRPVQVEEWLLLFSEFGEGEARIGYETVGKLRAFTVSTVWLGLDLSSGMRPRSPLIFETMVFDSDGRPVETSRYSTRDDAVRGHEQLVENYRLIGDREGPVSVDEERNETG